MTKEQLDSLDKPNGVKHAELPQLVLNAQYLRDLSFENPGAPQGMIPGKTSPEITVKMDVAVRIISMPTYEVNLKIHAKAKQQENVIFLVELSYAGLFTLHGIPTEKHKDILLVEGPRLLFPFARSILATATRDGGYPPLMLNPVDFSEMLRQPAEYVEPVPGQEGESKYKQ